MGQTVTAPVVEHEVVWIGQFPWPLFPTFIWGLFVIGHAYDVYWNDPLREELVQQEIEKLRAATSVHPLAAFDLDDDQEWR